MFPSLPQFLKTSSERLLAARRPRKAARNRRPGRKLCVEHLETRIVPSVAELVRDINLNTIDSSPGNFEEINGTVFFTADDGVHGVELWRSDGTEAGTVLLKDIILGSGTSSPGGLTNVNGTLFFIANDGLSGFELWKSDGTEAGTVLVKDIVPGSGTSSLGNLTNVNGTLFFGANDGVNGVELWRSDGTAAGTILIQDILPGSGSSSPLGLRLANVGGTLFVFFSASDASHARELWKSDGTAAGTVIDQGHQHQHGRVDSSAGGGRERDAVLQRQ